MMKPKLDPFPIDDELRQRIFNAVDPHLQANRAENRPRSWLALINQAAFLTALAAFTFYFGYRLTSPKAVTPAEFAEAFSADSKLFEDLSDEEFKFLASAEDIAEIDMESANE